MVQQLWGFVACQLLMLRVSWAFCPAFVGTMFVHMYGEPREAREVETISSREWMSEDVHVRCAKSITIGVKVKRLAGHPAACQQTTTFGTSAILRDNHLLVMQLSSRVS